MTELQGLRCLGYQLGTRVGKGFKEIIKTAQKSAQEQTRS